MTKRLESRIIPVASLADPVRRRAYLFVRDASKAVSREEVAGGLRISAKLAAFHLEKLLSAGLVQAHYERPPGRSGPGAGRSAKYYEPSEAEIEVTIPERRYDLAGRLLTEAIVTERKGERAHAAAMRVARAEGRRIGDAERAAAKLRTPGTERTIKVAERLLAERGYEPYRDSPDGLALRNCPFHALAGYAPELVCDMNQALIDGVLRGLGNDSVKAVLECKLGDCCVTLRAKH